MNKLETVNAICKIMWGNILVAFSIGMCVYTRDNLWLWAAIIGGVFFGIKALASIAQSMVNGAIGGSLDQPRPIHVAEPESSATPMGGAFERIPLLKGVAIKIGSALLIMILLVLIGSVGYLYYSKRVLQVKYGLISTDIEKGATRVVRKGNKTTIYRQGKSPVVLNNSRGSEQTFEVMENGDLRLNKVLDLIPKIVFIPNLGVVATPKRVEPVVGAQIVRSEDLGLGVNAIAGLESMGASITKDILNNTMVGISYTVDSSMQPVIGVHLGVFF